MTDTPLVQASAARNGTSAEPAGVQADPDETQEWLDALDGVIAAEGTARAGQLVENLLVRARTRGVPLPVAMTTPYVNTIPAEKQPPFPGDHDIEERLRHYVRWNAMAMVERANKGRASSAATWRPSSPRRPSTTSASTTSGTRRRRRKPATSSTFKATRFEHIRD